MQSVSCPVTSVSVTHLLAQQITFLQHTVWYLQNYKPTQALGAELHYATQESWCDETVWKWSERHTLNDVKIIGRSIMWLQSSRGNIHLATQEIYHPLWNPKIHYCPDQWARWIQFTHHYHIFVRLILVLPSHLTLNLPRGLFLSGFQPKIWMHFSSLPCMLCMSPSSFYLISSS